MSNGRWMKVSLCQCGWHDEPSFGSEWISRQHFPVCPDCGASAYSRKMVTARYEPQQRAKWWHIRKYKFIVKGDTK